MEINNCEECKFDKTVCKICRYEPLSSHAVLGKVGELLPCPFCGGEAYHFQATDDYESDIVYCEDCHCSKETVEEWNRRANFA